MIGTVNIVNAGTSFPKMAMTEIADGIFFILVIVAIVYSVRYGGKLAERRQVSRLRGMLIAGVLCLILGGAAMIAIHFVVFRHL